MISLNFFQVPAPAIAMAMACAFPMGFVNVKLGTLALTVPLVHTNIQYSIFAARLFLCKKRSTFYRSDLFFCFLCFILFCGLRVGSDFTFLFFSV